MMDVYIERYPRIEMPIDWNRWSKISIYLVRDVEQLALVVDFVLRSLGLDNGVESKTYQPPLEM